MKLAQYSKFLATVPGLALAVISLNILHGRALAIAWMVEIAATRLLVLIAPANAPKPVVQGDPLSPMISGDHVDTGTGFVSPLSADPSEVPTPELPAPSAPSQGG